MKHIRIHVRGTVQGVFFRANSKEKAEALGVTGSVRNCDDGSVIIEAEGTEEAIASLVEWCRQGPEMAQVAELDVEDGEMVGYDDFSILY